jgi:hypothetical protein
MSDPPDLAWQDPARWPNRPQPPSQVAPLRWVAIIGTSVVFLWRATSLSRMQPRQDWGIVVAIAAVLAVGFTCLALMPRATGRLRRHMDLLLPLGLYTVAEAVLDGLTAIPILSSLLTPVWPLKILSLSFSLSVMFVVQIALAVFYAGWTTALILQAVRQDEVDPILGFTSAPNWFLRVLGAESLGWSVLFAVLVVAITVGVAVLPLALLLIAVFSLVWNLMTAALLPILVAERGPFVESAKEGIRISWAGKGRWWLPVVAQMVLLGWVTFIGVSYTSNPRPGSVTTQSKTDFSVNGFWTGGYENECHWHTKLMAVAEAEPLPLAEFLLGIIFAVLAIVVKLEITDKLYPTRAIAEDDPRQVDYDPRLPM